MRLLRSLWLCWAVLSLTGCVGARFTSAPAKPFQFGKDTFAYANELVWEYSFDPATGERTATRREPKPDYTHHCFVVVRAARQFFAHARFDPALPRADEAAYRTLIRTVMTRSPRQPSGPDTRIVIPGYADLNAFSRAHAELLKEECGGAWQSYVQRGHWRMVLPFSRRHQSGMAEQLQESLEHHWPPVVHVVRFPSLAINHALLVFAAEDTAGGIDFHVYDPNEPDAPAVLRFDAAARTFFLPRNDYFSGGRVDVYEIYRGWIY